MKRLLLATLLFLLAPATAHAAITPSLKVDTFFGVMRDDFGSGIATESPAGVAAFGGRIYTVGWGPVGNDVGVVVVARLGNGTFDSGFSGDGQLNLSIGAVGKQDEGRGIAVLPDGRLRIVGDVDTSATSTANPDSFVVGLMPDGSMDTSFGGGDGIEVFALSPEEDSATRIAVDATGQLLIGGYVESANFKDAYVSLRNPDGSPVPSFGNNGVRVIPRAANGWNDDAADVAFRSGGGMAVLIRACIEANDSGCKADAIVKGLRDDGSDDSGFGNGGEVVLPREGTSLTPTAVIEHRGRLWIAASADMTPTDGDGFVARVEADGSGLQMRRFDIRGTYTGADLVDTNIGDMTVLAGPPETLVLVGNSAIGGGTNFFGAAALYAFSGDLGAAPYGDVVLDATNAATLNGVAADGPNAAAVSGLTLNSNFDIGFATSRLLLDADKKCDLAIDVPTPLELTFVGRKGAVAQIAVENKGERPCGGAVTLGAPYALGRAINTGTIEPGAKFVANGVPVTASKIRRDDDVARFTVTVDGDADASNNVRGVRTVFSFCDLALKAASKPATLPNEGGRRVEVEVRNAGTRTCRSVNYKVASGSGGGIGKRFAIERGRSVSDAVSVSAASSAKVGKKATVRVSSTSADDDMVASNDAFRLTARVVGVGDSRVGSASANRISGSATGGRGAKADRAGVRLARVEVAIRKVGGGCRWLVGSKFRKTSSCTPSGWRSASGKSSWRLNLRALPAGRYEVYSRAVTANGFREGRFSSKDGNRRAFRVR